MSVEAIPAAVDDLSSEPTAYRADEASPGKRGLSSYFFFFFVSGFCSILYELIWLRLAMAQFGVTTAMVSIVLSSFMAGLGVGSCAAGHVVRKYSGKLAAATLCRG